MNKLGCVSCILFVVTVQSALAFGQPLSEDDLLPAEQVTVARVTSGDSFYVRTARGGYRVRLLGVLAPTRHSNPQHARRSQQWLAQLLGGHNVRIRLTDQDDEERTRKALVWIDDSLVNESILQAGHAWYRPKQFESPAMAAAMENAKRHKTGMWSKPGDLVPPEDVDELVSRVRKASGSNAAQPILLKRYEEYKQQLEVAEQWLQRVRAYHDPHQQRHLLDEGRLTFEIQLVPSLVDKWRAKAKTLEEQTFGPWELYWKDADKLLLRSGEEGQAGRLGLLCNQGQAWFNSPIATGEAARLHDLAPTPAARYINLRESIRWMLAPTELTPVGKLPSDSEAPYFYDIVLDPGNLRGYVVFRPTWLEETQDILAPPLGEMYAALMIDAKTGRLMGVAPAVRTTDSTKLFSFSISEDELKWFYEDQKAVAQLKLPGTIRRGVSEDPSQRGTWLLRITNLDLTTPVEPTLFTKPEADAGE